MSNPMMRRPRKQQPITSVRDAFQQPVDHRKRLVARVDDELHSKFKALVARQERSINEVLEELITDYLDKHHS